MDWVPKKFSLPVGAFAFIICSDSCLARVYTGSSLFTIPAQNDCQRVDTYRKHVFQFILSTPKGWVKSLPPLLNTTARTKVASIGKSVVENVSPIQMISLFWVSL